MSANPKYISQSPLSVSKQIAQNMMFQKVTINHATSVATKPTTALPTGWKREEIIRQNGLNNGKSIIYYISPSGERITTQKALQLSLGDNFDLSLFDWRSGRFHSTSSKHRRNNDGDEHNDSKRAKYGDNGQTWTRRCQPSTPPKVVVNLNHSDSKISDKPSTHEALKQLFSERRLANRLAVDYRDRQVLSQPPLPPGLQTAGVPGYENAQLLQNIIASLSSQNGPITGQEQTVSAIEKNPCAVLNQNQPYIKNFIVSDDDIRKQQQRVNDLRKKLQAAINRPQNDY